MQQVKNKKFKFLALLFAAVVFTGSFSFCFMSISAAHASVRAAVSHEGCAESEGNVTRSGGMERNALLPCCVDNASTQRTYAFRDSDFHEPKFFPAAYAMHSDYAASFPELDHTSLFVFSSSPPGGEKLASIFKRE